MYRTPSRLLARTYTLYTLSSLTIAPPILTHSFPSFPLHPSVIPPHSPVILTPPFCHSRIAHFVIPACFRRESPQRSVTRFPTETFGNDKMRLVFSASPADSPSEDSEQETYHLSHITSFSSPQSFAAIEADATRAVSARSAAPTKMLSSAA